MSYYVYITRGVSWSCEGEPAITMAQWLDYVSSDPELQLKWPVWLDRDQNPSPYDPAGFVQWTAYSKNDPKGFCAWFGYELGNISTQSPNQEIVMKMNQIAKSLGAIVQGEWGEDYDEAGEMVIPAAPPESPSTTYEPSAKPWWKFWA